MFRALTKLNATMSYNPNVQPTCRSCGRVGVDCENCPGQGPYCGACKICKKKGHLSNDCVAKCFFCGQTGHMQRNCPTKMAVPGGPFGAAPQDVVKHQPQPHPLHQHQSVPPILQRQQQPQPQPRYQHQSVPPILQRQPKPQPLYQHRSVPPILQRHPQPQNLYQHRPVPPIVTSAPSRKRKSGQNPEKDSDNKKYRRWSTLNISISCPGLSSQDSDDEVGQSPSQRTFQSILTTMDLRSPALT